MRLHAALLERSAGWEQIFRQEGFPFSYTIPSDLHPERWSVVVLNRHLSEEEQDGVNRYLQEGGAVIGWTKFARFLNPGAADSRLVSYLLPDRVPWDTISLLDIAKTCDIPVGANSLPDQEGRSSAFVGSVNGGSAVILPFDPVDLLFDHRSTIRRFHAEKERLPFEQVSSVSKGELRHLISRSLEYLHHTRGLPYAHLWYYPDFHQSLFAFRVDTDGAPREDIEFLHKLAEQYQIPLTWYIDVQSHRSLLPLFQTMEADELSLHCYEHRNFDSEDETYENIRRGKVLMEEEGIQPDGYAAPYGEWNNRIGRAIRKEQFIYSSEFSFAYDTLPVLPELDDGGPGTLQVPIHPICIGSMLRVGYDTNEMIRYFRHSVQTKLLRREPLFYYHHPAQRFWEVVESLFRNINERGIQTTRLRDYAAWWKERESGMMVTDVQDGRISVRIEDGPSVTARVTMPDGSERFAKGDEGEISQGVGQWDPVPRIEPIPGIGRIRETDMRTSIARWYNHILRRVQ